MEYNIYSLHDFFTAELYEHHSAAALIWLLSMGRELEFTYEGRECFVSRDGSAEYVSLWEGGCEQSFDSAEALLLGATVCGEPFLAVWPDTELNTLF